MTANYTKFKVLLILLTAACLAPHAAQAQVQQRPAREKITGNVVTTDGMPAQWVNVALKDTFYATSTDAEGNFSMEAPAGSYTLSVFSITCHTKEFPVTIKKGGPNDFPNLAVVEDLKQLETIVVTGQFSPQSLRNSVYKVKAISREQIERKGAQNIQSLLNTEIGVRLSNDMALGETDFAIMGMSGHNVKILIDGMPVIDRNEKRQSLNQVDISMVERVEIIEGPMSVVYGTDALAGVINIITRKPHVAESKNTWSVNASVTEESVGSEYEPFSGKGLHRENVILNWGHRSGIYVQGSATRLDNGGWKGDAAGRSLTWPGTEQTLLNAMAGYRKGGLNVWYKLDYSENKTLQYNNPPTGSTDLEDVTYFTDRLNNQLQGDWKISNRVSVNAAASYQTLERRTRTAMTDVLSGEKWLSNVDASQDTSKMEDVFARATATWAVTPKLTIQPGVDYQWSKASGDRIEGSPSISDFAMYVSAEWKAAAWLDIRPGVRTQHNSVYSAPAAIPSLQTRFRINPEMDIRLSYGYGFRAPKLRELYFRFFNPNHDITGNPNLKAEYSNNLSAAFTWRILHQGDVRLTSTVTGFYNHFRDRIVTVITDRETTPMKATYMNSTRDKTAGGTLENSFAWKNLGANLSLSVVGRYNTLRDDDAYRDEDMSSYRFSPELSASVTYVFEKTGTGLNLFYKYNHKDLKYTANSDGQIELLGLNPYHLADFTVTQRVGKYVTLTGAVKNIFDVTMVRNTAGGGMGSSGNSSFVGSGRSFMLGVGFSISK